jgi:hypothetical protein
LEKSNDGRLGIGTFGFDNLSPSIFNNEIGGIHSHPIYKSNLQSEKSSMDGDNYDYLYYNLNRLSNYVYMPNTSRGPVLYNVTRKGGTFIKSVTSINDFPKIR